VSVALSSMVDPAIAHSLADGIAVGTVHGDTAEFVCRSRRLGLPRDGVGDDACDVVGCAVCRRGRSAPGDLLRLGGHAQCRVQRTAVDDSGQPVGAEQVAIADKGGAKRQVRLDSSGARAHGPHQTPARPLLKRGSVGVGGARPPPDRTPADDGELAKPRHRCCTSLLYCRLPTVMLKPCVHRCYSPGGPPPERARPLVAWSNHCGVQPSLMLTIFVT
jgi:hypothetical protein